jgi:thiamine pyrophosphate-dependent acetolactate synthase large subunit-like protein
VLGGAAPSLLQGRGALQDIDQLSVTAPHAKFVERVRRVRDIGPAMELAFAAACDGVPGPAFVECAVDLLYDQATVRKWYGEAAGERRSIAARCGAFYVSSGISPNCMPPARRRRPSRYTDRGQDLRQGVRPLIVIGGQALAAVTDPASLAAAVTRLGIPAYLSGTARGLLGRDHALQLRHARRQAMQEADCVVLAGVGATSAWITAGTCPV